MSARIELKGISKHYGAGDKRVDALKEVSLTIEAGEFLAVQGPSGSGKSTLLSICGLLDTPSSGQFFLNNHDMTHLNNGARCLQRRDEIGFIFQRHQLVP
ncbi:ATP-binding cassette domain-containing protein, partial [Pseudomonadota bacterium]